MNWKILAPIRHPDEIPPIVEAGAHELYLGILSQETLRRVGNVFSFNYRPHSNANLESLDQLREAIDRADGVPIQAVYNLRYPAELGQVVLDELSRAVELGISGVVLADVGLVAEVRSRHPDLAIHASGVAGISNSRAAALWRGLGADRLILPRALTRPEVIALDQAVEGVDLEMFITTEKCGFANAFCLFEHGVFQTEKPPAVRAAELAGRLARRSANQDMLVERLSVGSPTMRRLFYGIGKPMGSACTVDYETPLGPVCFVKPWENKEACGICSMWWMRDLGHLRALKVVGRTMPTGRKVADVRAVRDAMRALVELDDEELFEAACRAAFRRHRGVRCTPGLCYYGADA